jgi:hypothetical protein
LQEQKRVDVDFPAWMICETSDLIWRLQKIVSTLSVIGRLFSTHLRYWAMDLGFPIPVIGKVSKIIKLLLRSE